MPAIERYHRQVLLPQVGPEGQARLNRAAILVVGCGALGGVIADQLVRAGIGTLRLVDRDIVELTNLQRQVLFDESDVRDRLPKAVAAAQKLGRINSQVTIDAHVADVHADNIEALAGCEGSSLPVDLILDATDNVSARYLINDVSVKHCIPWVYGGCVGTEGRCMAIVPPDGPCLRCVFPNPPAASELPTCDTAGVLAAAAAIVASLQVAAAMKVLLDRSNPSVQSLLKMDVWQSRFTRLSLVGAKHGNCPTCGHRDFEFLERSGDDCSVTLCGRNAIQVNRFGGHAVDLAQMEVKLSRSAQVQRTQYFVRCQLHEPNEILLTVFPDGRAIIQGTTDPDRAKSIYARFVGD